MEQNTTEVSVAARRLVGRDEELDAIVRLLDADDLLPRTAVLPGEAGIGKTALWLAGIEAARDVGRQYFLADRGGDE